MLVNIALDEDVRCLQVSWPCQVWFEIVVEDVVFVPCSHKQNEKRQNDTGKKKTAEAHGETELKVKNRTLRAAYLGRARSGSS